MWSLICHQNFKTCIYLNNDTIHSLGQVKTYIWRLRVTSGNHSKNTWCFNARSWSLWRIFAKRKFLLPHVVCPHKHGVIYSTRAREESEKAPRMRLFVGISLRQVARLASPLCTHALSHTTAMQHTWITRCCTFAKGRSEQSFGFAFLVFSVASLLSV